jgi:hypothetical protein
MEFSVQLFRSNLSEMFRYKGEDNEVGGVGLADTWSVLEVSSRAQANAHRQYSHI